MTLILIQSISERYLSDDELNEVINEFYEERDAQESIDKDAYPLKDIRKSIL